MLSRGRTVLLASAAGSLGGAALAAVDAVRATTALGDQADGNVVELVAALVGRYGMTGAFVGCVGGLVASVVGLMPTRSRRRAVALLGVVAGAWLATRLYAGPAIREHWAAWPLRIATPVLVGVAAVAFVEGVGWCARGPRLRLACGGVVAVTLAVALDAFDTWGLLGAYGYLRTTLWLAILALLGLAIALPWIRAAGRGQRIAAACVVIVAVLAVFATPEGFIAFAFRERARYGARCLDAWRSVFPPDRTGDVVEADAEFQARRAAELSPAHRARVRQRLDEFVPNRDHWNLLWITIDTLRADRLSCHGHRPITTPVLDKLAGEGALFEQATAQFPITHYSFQSMFYGRYPTATPLFRSARGIREQSDKSVTLAGLLSRRGFFTGTVPAVPPARLKTGPYEVMATGFEVVQPGRPKTWKNAAEIQTHCAKTFLEQAKDRRWHLWLHYMEPHLPYDLHPEHDFGSSREQLYLSEIARADAEIGKVLQSLRDLGVYDKTVIVVNSDHGEAFGEHNSMAHGSTLYEEQIHVPLIIRVPGLKPRALKTPVENVDIMPTMIDLLDVDHDLAMQGSSLVPLLVGGDADPDAPEDLQLAELPGTIGQLSSTTANRDAFRHGDWKLVWNPSDGFAELYDLAADPHELRNVAEENKDVVAAMRGMLAVLKAESASVNRAGDVRVEDLQTVVSGLPPEQRGPRLRRAIRAQERGVRDALESYLADASMPESLRRQLTLEGESLLADGLADAAWRLVTPRSGWASIVAGLDLLTHCARPTLVVDDARAGTLRELLAAPAPVSLRAALVLARAGRSDGRARLQTAAEAAVGEERFLGLVGMAMLGVGIGRSELEQMVVPLAMFPSRCVPLLEGLAGIPSASVVPMLWELLEESYLNHRVRDAALALLERLDTTDAVVAWLPSLSTWDPETTVKARAIADRVFGRERRQQLEEAGRLAAEAYNGANIGRYRHAVEVWKRAADICGNDRAAAPCLLQAARLLHLMGEDAERDALRRRIAESGAAEAWLVAAARLPDVPRKEAPIPLIVAEIRPSGVVPQIPAMNGLWRVRVTNPGPHHVPGGRWPLAPVWLAAFARGRDRLPFDAVRQPLLQGGVAAGASRWIWVQSRVPPLGGDLDLRLAGLWPRGGGVPLPRANRTTLPLRYPGSGAVGVDPTDVTFSGRDIYEGWIPAPGLLARDVDEDGSFRWVAGGRETWLLSALLADRKKPVVLEIELAAESRHADTARIRVEVAWADTLTQPPVQSLDLDVPANGQWSRQEREVPAQDGKGVRWLRITPLDGSEIVRIKGVRIRVP